MRGKAEEPKSSELLVEQIGFWYGSGWCSIHDEHLPRLIQQKGSQYVVATDAEMNRNVRAVSNTRKFHDCRRRRLIFYV